MLHYRLHLNANWNIAQSIIYVYVMKATDTWTNDAAVALFTNKLKKAYMTISDFFHLFIMT